MKTDTMTPPLKFMAKAAAWVLARVLSERTFTRLAHAMSPAANVAGDDRAVARALYLMKEHRWNSSIAFASPQWIRGMGAPLLILLWPVFIFARLLHMVWQLVQMVLVTAFMMVMCVWDMVSYIAHGSTRILFYHIDLRDAERRCVDWMAEERKKHPQSIADITAAQAALKAASDKMRQGVESGA